jgi:Tol biopolymer transport system component
MNTGSRELRERLNQRQWVAIIVALMQLSLSSCGAKDEPIDEEIDRPFTYSSPSWSIQGEVAYGDRGYRETAAGWVYVDSLAGIWTVDVATAERRRITAFGRYPSWSPDGSALSFWNNYALWIYDVESGDIRNILSGGGYNNSARWSPCGETLIYASTENAPFDYTIWAIDVATAAKRQVTPEQGGYRSPLWFCGCDSVLCIRYTLDEGSNIVSDIYQMTNAGQSVSLILPTMRDSRGLGMSPDGRYISYYSATNSAGNRIYIYDRYIQQYLNGPIGVGMEGTWSPDSRQFLFVAPGDRSSETRCSLLVYDIPTGNTWQLVR